MSTFLLNDDWKIQAARGKLRNSYHVHKFGANSIPANGQEETVWDGSNLYPWTTWNGGADNVFLKSSDSNDAGITVFIQGLDANYDLQSEIVTLDSTDPTATAVSSSNTYIRLFRMYNTSNQQEVGNISALYGSASGTPVAIITAGEGQTLMSVYTVPDDHVALILKYDFSGSANSAIKSRLLTCVDGGTFRTQHAGSTYGGQYTYEFGVPLIATAKTDIDLRITAGTGSAYMAACFNLLVIKDNEFNVWSSGY